MSNKQTSLQTTTNIINLISLCFIWCVIVFTAHLQVHYFKNDLEQQIEEIGILFLLGILNTLPCILLWRTTQRASHPTDHLNLLIISVLILTGNIYCYINLFWNNDTKFIGVLLTLIPIPQILITLGYYLYLWNHTKNTKKTPNQ